jgi:aminoglycoside phosphotransferase (APT) family kinase protein
MDRRYRGAVWSYYCDRRPGAPALVIGTAMEASALAQHGVAVVPVRLPGLHGRLPQPNDDLPAASFVHLADDATVDAPSGSFELVVVHDVGAVAAVLSPRLDASAAVSLLCREVARLLQPGGEFVMNLRSYWLREGGAHATRRVRPGSLIRSMTRARLTVSRVLRLREDIDGSSLYAVEPLRTDAASLGQRLRARAVVRLRAPALSFIGRVATADRRPSRLSTIVAEASGRPPDGQDPRLVLGSFDVYVVVAESSIVRIPFTAPASDRCATNLRSLENLTRYRLPLEVPRSLGRGTSDGVTWFAETRVRGQSVDPLRLSMHRRQALARSAVDTLEKFQVATRSSLPMTELHFARLFREPASRVGAVARRETAERLQACLEVAWRRLGNRPFTAVVTHGDFKCGNIVWAPGGAVAGLIDWDMATTEGLPLVDHLTYLAWDRVQERAGWLFADALLEERGAPGHLQFCEQVLDVSDFARRCYALITLVSHAAHPHGLPWFAMWYQRYIGNRLDVACERFLERAAG